MSEENQLVKLPISDNSSIRVNPQKYEQAEDEFEELKSNLMDLAEHTNKSIVDMLEIVKASQHPKMYESLSKMIAAAAMLNKEAAEIVRRKIDLYGVVNQGNQQSGGDTINDNRTLVLTSTELLDQILARNNNDDKAE